MNTTLKTMETDWQTGTARGRTLLNATRMNNVYRTKALRRRHWITGDAIECVNKTATKLRYLGEGVILTATIFDERGTSNIELHLTRLIAPFVRILSRCQLGDELIERRVPVANTGAGTEHCIE